MDIASIQHSVDSLTHLFSFNHAQCDVLLEKLQLDVGTFRWQKGEWERDSTYVGVVVLFAWTSFVWFALRKHKQRAFVLPLFMLFALLGAYAQVNGMVEYIDKCRSVLAAH